MARAAFAGWKAATGERPLRHYPRLLQRLPEVRGGVERGDNLRALSGAPGGSAIPQQCSLGLSGMAFHGTDIGGFGAGLHAGADGSVDSGRGASRPCSAATAPWGGTRVQEPWRFGDEVTAIFRKYVKLRYRLQPYFYDLFRECEETGLPPMRALVLNYEDDPNVHELNDEFMLGDQMLVAPVVEQGARQRMIYLPKGDWYDFWTGEKQEGGRYFVREAPLDLCPIYVKAGHLAACTRSSATPTSWPTRS